MPSDSEEVYRGLHPSYILSLAARTHKDEQIAELQQALIAERDARREERFFFILVSVVLFDVVVFSAMGNSGGPLALFLLEALILIPIARRLGLEEAHTLLGRLMGRIAAALKGD